MTATPESAPRQVHRQRRTVSLGRGPQPRSRKARQPLTADLILKAAVARFGRSGYRGTSLATVAQMLGVTRQALYHYFPLKEDLLVALFDDFHARLEVALNETVGGDEVGPARRFDLMLVAFFRTIAEDPDQAEVSMKEFDNLSSRNRAEILKWRRSTQDRFVSTYREAQAAERFKSGSATIAVSLLLGAANWVCRWYRHNGSLDPDSMAQTCVSFLRDAYLCSAT
jgi:AcrR family transcriptional regulator